MLGKVEKDQRESKIAEPEIPNISTEPGEKLYMGATILDVPNTQKC